MSPTRSPPLVGRETELAVLTAALTDALEGNLKVVVVEGEPGVGKTRLVTEAVDSIGPARILQGQGHELGRERPFGIMTEALGIGDADMDPAQELIAAMLRGDPMAASGTASEYAELRHFTIEAMVALIGQWAEETPLLCILEDLHWADPSSLLTLDHVMNRLSEMPIGILATMRPSPRSVPLEQLLRGVSREEGLHLRLSPLDDGAVEELASSLAGASPGPTLRRLLDGAAGNPFFITELVSALSDDDKIVIGGDQAETTTSDTIPSLRATVLHRLQFLPSQSLDLLRVAAVTGSRFRLDDLSVVLATPASGLLETLDEAIRAGFVVASDSAFVFRHHLVWDALYHDLPLASREALHVQVARRLAEADRPATQVATHFLAGSTPGDRQAISWLEKAAAEAISSAPDVAAQLLEGALHLAGESFEAHDHLTVELATAMTWAGRIDEAEAILEDLATRVPVPEEDINVRLGLARIQVVQGKPGAARLNYEQLVDEPALRGGTRARALADQAVACLMSGDVAGADLAAKAALEEGEAVSDDPAVCGALSASAWVSNLAGRTTEAVELAERAVEVAEQSSARETGRRYPHVFLGVVLVDADRLDDARRMFDVGRRMAEAYGDAWQIPIHHLEAALVDYYAGNLEDTVTALATADDVVEEVGTRVLHVWSSALGAHVAIERDDLSEADRLLSAAEQHVAESGPGMGYDWLLWGRARLLEAEDDTSAATAVLNNAWGLAESLGIVSQRRLIGPDLVRLLRATDQRDRAIEVAEALASAAEMSGVRSARAAAERCLGLAHDDPDRVVAAVELVRSCPQRLEQARTCEDAGSVLIDASREEEAKTMLTEAVDLYHSCGVRRSERRVTAELRRLGVRQSSREARDRPATGWEALTPTELEVSALAAEGLTNPEIGRRLFISRRTVETHLSHVYAKLGVSSRVELAAEAAVRSGN